MSYNVEGRWDCSFCSVKGNLGRYKRCPGCGADRKFSKIYFPDMTPVTDANVLKLTNVGPDWQCNFCSSSNQGNHTFCTQCGAGKDGSEPKRPEHYYGSVDDRPTESPDEPSSLASISEPTLISSSRGASTYSTVQPTSSKPNRARQVNPFSGISSWHVALLGLLIAVVFGAFLLLRTHEVEATATEATWSRTIQVEEYRTVREGGWSIPAGGRQVSTEQRVQSYRDVFSHNETRTRQVVTGSETYACGTSFTDTGDGFGRVDTQYCTRNTYGSESYQEAVYRQEPVYATWYHYDINRWVVASSPTTSGQRNREALPYWPELSLECEGQAELGCERRGRQTQTLVITFTEETDDDDAKTYHLTVSEADWWEYQIGATYTLVVNSLGIQNDPLRHNEEE